MIPHIIVRLRAFALTGVTLGKQDTKVHKTAGQSYDIVTRSLFAKLTQYYSSIIASLLIYPQVFASQIHTYKPTITRTLQLRRQCPRFKVSLAFQQNLLSLETVYLRVSPELGPSLLCAKFDARAFSRSDLEN